MTEFDALQIRTPIACILVTESFRGIRVGVLTNRLQQPGIVVKLRGLVAMLDVFPAATSENERPAEVVREGTERSLRLEEADCPEGRPSGRIGPSQFG